MKASLIKTEKERRTKTIRHEKYKKVEKINKIFKYGHQSLRKNRQTLIIS